VHKRDRTGILILAFSVFALYLIIADWFDSLGLVSLPLSSIKNNVAISIVLIDVIIINIYAFRKRKRAQRPTPTG
jgi:hypothetical protein